MTSAKSLTALTLAAFLIAGCGFAPIYARPDANYAPLRGISVQSRGQERSDYIFAQVMADKLGAYTPSGEYVLETVISESRLGFGIRVDDVATRYESTVTVQYRLVRASDGTVILQGARSGVSSYDVPSDPYSELAAEQKSIERAVELAAEKLRMDLTLYFANLPENPPQES
jgi:LPS-assembly lipoprotein